MKSKVCGYVLAIGSIYYLLAEAISAIFFKDSLINTYLFHTISELGIPGVNSPFSILMNSAFILMGLALIFTNFYGFKDFITKNKAIFYILTLVTGLGVIIVGLIHGGNPLTLSYHASGAVMAILGGNLMLMIISRSMDDFGKYQKFILVLGIIGFIPFWIMFYNIESIYMPVFERLSVYTLIVWSFVTGVNLIKG